MGNFEERFLSDKKKMGAYQTLLLLVLLSWTPQQSICKPHHHGGPHTTEHHTTEHHGTAENHGTEHHGTDHHGTEHHGTAEHHGGPHGETTTSMPVVPVVLCPEFTPQCEMFFS